MVVSNDKLNRIPIVSIIVPCYNQAKYLDECLQSVLNLNFIDWECIIVNDGSTDNTDEVSKVWLEKNNRFKYIFQENAGLSATRNKGIENAIGKFILPLDADDKISKDYCKLAIEEFENDSDLKVVYCRAEKFGIESGKWILEDFTLENLAKFNMIFCSAFFRKNDWQKVGRYDVKMIYGLEDWEFWISILKNGGKVKRIDKICFFYRVKNLSMVTDLNGQKRKLALEYLSIKHVDFFVKQLGSYPELYNILKHSQNKNYKHLRGKKTIIDLFCRTFLGFTLFKTLK